MKIRITQAHWGHRRRAKRATTAPIGRHGVLIMIGKPVLRLRDGTKALFAQRVIIALGTQQSLARNASIATVEMMSIAVALGRIVHVATSQQVSMKY